MTIETLQAARPRDTLTSWERRALGVNYDLADGHPQGRCAEFPPAVVEAVFNSSPAAHTRQIDVEQLLVERFFRIAGQEDPSLSQRPMLHYSASISIDVVAKVLQARGVRRVGVLNPTFDMIPLILARQGLTVEPITEGLWSDPERGVAQLGAGDALFVVTPNNPTGREPTADEFRRLSEVCRDAKIILIFDFSLRFFGQLSRWTQYRVLADAAPLQYLCIEDTGKTWPAGGLKAAMLIASLDLIGICREVSNELLLTVAPTTLQVLLELLALETPGGRPEAPQIVAQNRKVLNGALGKLGWKNAGAQSGASVGWLQLAANERSSESCLQLLRRSVAILPGGPFYWSESSGGDRFVRVALFRDSDWYAEAIDHLVDAWRKVHEPTD